MIRCIFILLLQLQICAANSVEFARNDQFASGQHDHAAVLPVLDGSISAAANEADELEDADQGMVAAFPSLNEVFGVITYEPHRIVCLQVRPHYSRGPPAQIA